MGAGARSGLTEMVIGNTAERFAMLGAGFEAGSFCFPDHTLRVHQNSNDRGQDMKIERILLTTDFSDHAQQAYACAADLASKCGARLHLVHFAGSLPFAGAIARFGDTTASGPLYASLENALAEEANEHPAFDGIDIRPHLQRHRWTRTRQRELEQELGIDLIILSPQGRTGLAKMLLGSFADRIVRHSSVPVLLFRPIGEQRILNPRTVLVPHDFYDASPTTLPAMRWLDSQFGSAFRFLYVYDPSWAAGRSIRGMEEQFERAVKNMQCLSVEERFTQAKDEYLQGLDVTLETAQGHPPEQVVQRARDRSSDLVLLATRGGLGSVSRKVITNAKCSVLAVPVDEGLEQNA